MSLRSLIPTVADDLLRKKWVAGPQIRPVTAPGSTKSSQHEASNHASPSSCCREILLRLRHDLYRHRYKVEKLLAKVRDWRHTATRYDR
jgi:hypothetical protein